jgi:hypothetical protein
MEALHTDTFDATLIAALPQALNYPESLPFIGNNWTVSETKILFIGESHYIPGKVLSDMLDKETHVADWYQNNSNKFDSYLSNYINTRDVIDKAEKIKEHGFRKPLTIFYNMKSAIKETDPALVSLPFVFPMFSFYNYFQRPAFEESKSIDNNSIDDQVAFRTLQLITEIIKPKKIVFVSQKAKRSFDTLRRNDQTSKVFKDVMIEGVQHPSCAWWNKKSQASGGRTGRQKFIDILKNS